jgi:hypothetical protein
MKLLILFFGMAAGIDHILSFNMGCDATANFLAGTTVQAAIAADRVPFQFVHAFERVLQARAASVPNCQSFGNVETVYPGIQPFSQLFGLQIINVLRWLDSADTTIDNAVWPPSCNQNAFGWNWQWLRKQFPGIKMPATCSASTFYGKDCHLTFQLVPGFNVTLWLKDTCTDPTKPGYHLPQGELRCTGTLCGSFGMPCTSNADCGSVTCDPVNAYLDNATSFLESVGLFNTTNDAASCPPDAQGFTFAEQFFSKILNNAANLIGLTPSVTAKKWHQLSICGASTFQTQYIPTTAPTPVVFFKCGNGTQIQTSFACNGVNDCQGGEDEWNCGCGQGGGLIMSSCGGQCCSVCDSSNNCCGSAFQGGQYCSLPYNGGGNGPQICTADPVSGIYDCSQYIGATSGATGTISYPQLQSVQNPNTNQNIIGWADCSGNAQIGNPAAIGVVNLLHPYHTIANRLESIIKSMEGCRAQADTSDATLRAHFYLWGVNWLGGIFFNTDSATTAFKGQTPAALADDSMRWYSSSHNQNCTQICNPPNCSFGCSCYQQCTYITNPPFANLLPTGWSTCNSASLAGSYSCQLNAAVQSWFAGTTGFPSSWGTTAAYLEGTISSNCPNDVFPQAFLVCDGPCGVKNTADSGCCIMSKPLITIPAGGACPQGYTSQPINSSITDFLFNTSVYNSSTQDTTLINFLQLLADHAFDFTTNPAFVSPSVSGPQSICIINGSTFGNNIDGWANQTYTESCPAPMTTPNGLQGCPQILGNGPVQACGGAQKCLTPPAGTPCVGGCPSGPTPAGCAVGFLCSSGSWVAPAVLVTLVLQLVI